MSRDTITETCSCGATFQATGWSLSTVAYSAAQWRKQHKHAEGAGICGHQRTLIDGTTLTCNLKADHAGLHADGQGYWITPSPDRDPWDDQPECTPCADGRHAYCTQSPACECFTNPGVHGESGGSTL